MRVFSGKNIVYNTVQKTVKQHGSLYFNSLIKQLVEEFNNNGLNSKKSTVYRDICKEMDGSDINSAYFFRKL